MKKLFVILFVLALTTPSYSFAGGISQTQCKNISKITSKSIYDTCCVGASPVLACGDLTVQDKCGMGILSGSQCVLSCDDIDSKAKYNQCCVNSASSQQACASLSVSRLCVLGVLSDTDARCNFSAETKDDYYALCKKNPAQRAGSAMLDQFCQTKEQDIPKMCEWGYKSFADCQAYFCPKVVANSIAGAAWSCRDYTATTAGIQDKEWYVAHCDPALLASSIVDPTIKATCEAKAKDVDTMCLWGVGQFTKEYCQKIYQDRYSICQSLESGSQEWQDRGCESVQSGAVIWGSTQTPQQPGGFDTSTLLKPISIKTTCQELNLSKVDFSSFPNFFLWVRCYIAKLFPFLLTIAFLVFMWNIINYIIKPNPLKADERKKYIIAGLVGLFVIVAMWGLVTFVSKTLGLPSVVPQLPYNYTDSSGKEVQTLQK